jgi:Fic family protein
LLYIYTPIKYWFKLAFIYYHTKFHYYSNLILVNINTKMYDKVYIPMPDYDSNTTKLMTSLEKLRNRDNILSQWFKWVWISIFFGLKEIFQIVESVASARIEWNRTTVSQFIRWKSNTDLDTNKSQKRQEILNIYEGIKFINDFKDNWKEIIINSQFFSQLHQILMKDLLVWDWYEWDIVSWEYRKHNVTISQSNHIPPDFTQVWVLMDELIDFINNYKSWEPHFDLLKVSIVHHRFVWIHPYWNWNWRMVRLLTYALLIKYW